MNRISRPAPRGLVVLAGVYYALLVTGVLLVLLAGPASAHPAAVLPVLSAVNDDDELILTGRRPTGEVRDDLGDSRAAASAAGADLEAARQAKARTEARIELKKREIDQIKAEAKLADTENREADKKSHEARKKNQEIRLKLLEREKEMRDAEIARAEAARDAARAVTRALEREESLARKRESRDSIFNGDAEDRIRKLREADRDLRDLEKNALEAMKERFSREESLAKRSRELVEKRLKVYETQKEVRSSRS